MENITFADARNGDHRTLTGHMLKQLVSVRTQPRGMSLHPEYPDPNVSHHADFEESMLRCLMSLPSPKALHDLYNVHGNRAALAMTASAANAAEYAVVVCADSKPACA